MSTMSPRDSAIPVRTAALLPWLVAWRSTRSPPHALALEALEERLGGVARAVVHHDRLDPERLLGHAAQHLLERRGLVVGRDDHAHERLLGRAAHAGLERGRRGWGRAWGRRCHSPTCTSTGPCRGLDYHAPPVLERLAARNPTALAAAIFAALSLLFVAPALIPGRTLSSTDYLYSQIPWSAAAPAGYTAPSNTELYDPAFQFIPWLEYTRAELPGDELLWNPHMAAGRPYLANMQSGVFSPFSLPTYLLPVLVVARARGRDQAVRGELRHLPPRAPARPVVLGRDGRPGWCSASASTWWCT